MAVTADQIGTTISPYVDQVFGAAWIIMQFILLLGGIIYIIMLLRFNVRVNVREFTKGARTITYSVKAREYLDRKSNVPKLQFFGIMGIMGHVINQPPSQCVIPYRGFFAKKAYDFVKKDGLYYPVENVVLGKRYDLPSEVDTEKEATNVEQAFEELRYASPYEVGLTKDSKSVIYSLDGSGLEISRDYEAEQAIENTMMTKAEQFRNQKPSVLYAMYGLAIILAIGSFAAMLYGWYQFGNMAGAISSLGGPLQQGVQAAVEQKIGP